MPDQSAPRQIQIGDRTVTIHEPNGYKFLEATELLGEISEQVPDLLDRRHQFVQKFRAENGTTLTKLEARLRYPEDFKADEETGDYTDQWWADRGDALTLPGPSPSTEMVFMALFGHVFRQAKARATRMVALFAIPDGELEQAEIGGTLDDKILEWERFLLHRGKISQLALILGWSVAAMREEFAADGEAAAALGEVRALFQSENNPGTPTHTTTSTAPNEPEPFSEPQDGHPDAIANPDPPPPAAVTRESSDDATRPNSSTDSPTPSDGTDERSSTDHPGPSFAESAPSYASGT